MARPVLLRVASSLALVLGLAACDTVAIEPPPPKVVLPPEVVAGPVCVFQVVGTSNAVGSSEHPELTADALPRTALMWTPTAGPDVRDVDYLDDPVFDNDTTRGSMWPAFARAFYAESGCIPFLGSTAEGGGRMTPLFGTPSACGPRDLDVHEPQNNWHPDCHLKFDDAVADTYATISAAERLYPDRDVYFGGWLWNIGNDQLNTPDAYSEGEYNRALDDFYAAFEDEFPGRGPAYADSRVFYIQSTVVIPEADEWDAFAAAEGDACADHAAACRSVAPVAWTVYEEYRSTCRSRPCPIYRDDRHWEYEALNDIGSTAGAAVGQYLSEILNGD
jgi:hypothetical protein